MHVAPARSRPTGGTSAGRGEPGKSQPTNQEATVQTNIAPQHEHQLVFTSSQAARYLGVSLATIRRWTDAGYLTGYRTPGGQRRFSREQLDGFIASLQLTGTGAQPKARKTGRRVA
jgi:excisionase family DNA binding protein